MNPFKQVKLDEECPQIRYEYSVNRFGPFNLIDTLVVSFSGTYRDGAAGRPDAGLMKGIVITGLEVLIIFDDQIHKP